MLPRVLLKVRELSPLVIDYLKCCFLIFPFLPATPTSRLLPTSVPSYSRRRSENRSADGDRSRALAQFFARLDRRLHSILRFLQDGGHGIPWQTLHQRMQQPSDRRRDVPRQSQHLKLGIDAAI